MPDTHEASSQAMAHAATSIFVFSPHFSPAKRGYRSQRINCKERCRRRQKEIRWYFPINKKKDPTRRNLE
jgi:hypothetical protein